MIKLIHPGAGILFMKVGTHAQESLEAIIARKTKEIEDAGFAMWGYGGNTCHPQSMVQPFARSFEKRGETIYLCMQEMDSKHFAEPLRASKYSVDGINWNPMHKAISVVGSRYALVLKSLRRDEFELPLANTRVALGNSLGRRGDAYVKGRVDKACLEIAPPEAKPDEPSNVKISLVAELADPFAVYVKDN